MLSFFFYIRHLSTRGGSNQNNIQLTQARTSRRIFPFLTLTREFSFDHKFPDTLTNAAGAGRIGSNIIQRPAVNHASRSQPSRRLWSAGK